MGPYRKRKPTPTFSSDPPAPDPDKVTGPLEHPTPKRIRVKQMRIDGKSLEEIKEATGVSTTSQYNIFNGYTYRPGRQRPGRTAKIDRDTI